MSTVKTNNVQIGQSVTATNNFTWYQPATPDGTVRLGNGNSGSVTDLVTLTSAGNLGIGTSSPIDKLHVAGGVTSTALSAPSNTSIGSVQLGYDGTNGVLRTWNSSPLRFDTAGVQRLLIDSSGNLGLGVTPSGSSTKTFEIGNVGNVVTTTGSNEIQVAAGAYYNAGWKYAVTGSPVTNYYQSGGLHYWRVAASGTAGNAISFTQAMTLDADGNLLVGTTSAAIPLSGRGLVELNGSSTAIYALKTNNVLGGTVFLDSSSYLRLKSETSASRLYCTAYTAGVYLATNATSWTSASDEREKDIIESIENAVAKVNTLRSVIGKYKTDEPDKRRAFLIAQDVQAVLPEAVDASDPDKLGVAYTDTIPLLVAAIKELSAELNELKRRIN